MTDTQANYLVSIVMCGSFRDAADALFVTPSTISQSIAALESEYGVKLLLRTRGGIVLTPLGEKLYTLARDIVKRFDEAEKLKESLAEGRLTSRDISIAVFGSGLRRCLRPILLTYLRSSVNTHFVVKDADPFEIPKLLNSDTVRFAVVSAPSYYYKKLSSDFSCQILSRMNLMLQVSKSNPLCQQFFTKHDSLSELGTYSLSDLSEYNFVFQSEEMLRILEAQIPTFPWKEQTILISSDSMLTYDLMQSRKAISVSFDDHLFLQGLHDETVFVPMCMGSHFLNMHCFVIAKDIKALIPEERLIISEIRRSIMSST